MLKSLLNRQEKTGQIVLRSRCLLRGKSKLSCHETFKTRCVLMTFTPDCTLSFAYLFIQNHGYFIMIMKMKE